LTYLAQTPNTSYLDSRVQDEKVGSGSRLDQASARTQGPQWRDKYVLKFNGWNATQPDSKLPPASSRTTQSPFHAGASTQPSRTSQDTPPSQDDKSSDESAGRRPSFDQDSKEVYAHGELLQPRATYELDLMSSSRSFAGISATESTESDKLQRKRTNSL